MATFGKTTIGATQDYNSANFVGGSKFTLTEDASVTKITLYCRGAPSAALVKCAIYDDDGGSPSTPNNLRGVTQEVLIGTSYAWIDFIFSSPISLTAGIYWLMFNQNQDIAFMADAGTNRLVYTASTYPTFPDPLIGEIFENDIISIYATYMTPATPSPGPSPPSPPSAIGTLIVLPTLVSADIQPPSAVLNGQVTIAAPRVPLAAVSTPIKSVTIENPNTNAVVYVGNVNVVAGDGYRLWPGATVSMDIDDLNKVNVTGTVGQVVSYIAVN